MPDENPYCTESCTECYIENFTTVPYTHPPGTSLPHRQHGMLDKLFVNHQSTIHSMNAFPINLTAPKPCQIGYFNIFNIKFCTQNKIYIKPRHPKEKVTAT